MRFIAPVAPALMDPGTWEVSAAEQQALAKLGARLAGRRQGVPVEVVSLAMREGEAPSADISIFAEALLSPAVRNAGPGPGRGDTAVKT